MRPGLLLNTEAERAWGYRPGQPPEEVSGYDTELSGELVLPGFGLDPRPLRKQA